MHHSIQKMLIGLLWVISTANCSSGAGKGDVCGGSSGKVCSDDLYCSYADYSCGSTDVTGVCAERPESCVEDDAPPINRVCGCDGIIYMDGCEANARGQDTGSVARCSLDPKEEFSCGDSFICTIKYYEYCFGRLPQQPNGETLFYCRFGTLPFDCPSFLTHETHENCTDCKTDSDGNITLVCAN